MPLYNCECCNYNTKLKHDYNKHLNTRKHLRKKWELEGGLKGNSEGIQIYDLMNINEHKMNINEHKKNTNEHKININKSKKFKCNYCFHKFNTKPSLRRHELHYCKENRDYKTLLFKAEKEKKELFKQIEKLIDKAGNKTITTYNTQNNIVLNSYGKENLEHITDEYKMEILQKYAPIRMIPKLIRDIHFNDAIPENKNIVYPNKKENKLKVFKEGKWLYEDKSDTINDLIDGKYNIIDEHYDKHSYELNDIKQCRYSKFRNLYDDNNKAVTEELQEQCEYILLNSR